MIEERVGQLVLRLLSAEGSIVDVETLIRTIAMAREIPVSAVEVTARAGFPEENYVRIQVDR